MDAPIYDYSRSFLQFTTDHSNHTPRMQLEASCWLSGEGEGVEFFLTSDCISERMYSPSGLVHRSRNHRAKSSWITRHGWHLPHQAM